MLDYIDLSTMHPHILFWYLVIGHWWQYVRQSPYESTEGLSVELESTDPQVTVTIPSVLVTLMDNNDGQWYKYVIV